MTRRRKVLLAVGVIVLVALGGLVWTLPEIVRRAAVARIPEITGRAVSIEDVDLNLLTGRFVIQRLRLAEREGPEALVAIERVEGRLSLLSLVLADIRLTELRLTAPALRVIRTGPGEFNFSDLLPLFLARDPARPPGRWTFTVDQLSLEGGAATVEDRAVSPSADWSLTGLGVEATGITTRAGRSPGRLALRTDVGAATLEVTVQPLYLAPVSLTARIALTGFDLARALAYIPATLPASPATGTLALALTAAWEREPAGIKTASVSGELRLDGLSVVQRGRTAPFVTLPRLAVRIREADLVGRQITLERVELDGLQLRMVRDRQGRIDLLEAFPPVAAAPAQGSAAASAAETAAVGLRLRVEQLALAGATIAFTDEAVSPPQDWRIEELAVEAQGLSNSPEDEPGRATARARLSGGAPGRESAALALDVQAIRLVPPGASLRVALTGFDLAALRPYVPDGAVAAPSAGTLDLSLSADVARAGDRTTRATISGEVQLAGLGLTRGDAPEPFATASRIAVGIGSAVLIERAVTLASVTADGVTLRLARGAAGGVEPFPATATRAVAQAPAAAAGPATGAPASGTAGEAPATLPFKVRLDRLSLRAGSVSLSDEAVSPRREWRLEGLSVDAAGLSTSGQDPPGTLQVKAQVVTLPGSAGPAALAVESDSVRVLPFAGSMRVVLAGFDVTAVGPYLPPTLPAAPAAGALALDLRVGVETGARGLSRAKASGSVTLTDLSLIQRGQPEPFLRVPRLALGLKEADALARTLALATVDIEAMDLRAVRDVQGTIDLLGLVTAPPAGGEALTIGRAPAPRAAAAPAGEAPWKISLDRLALSRGTATFEDRAVSPTTVLPVTDLAVAAENITWPAVRPGTLSVSAGLPGGGLLLVQGTATLAPLEVTVSISTLDAPIQPYHAYFPFRARFGGLFSGDSLSTVKVEDGRIIAASQGNAWIKDFQVIPPDSTNPVIRMERMEIRGIDFAWPTYAFVDRVSLLRPEVRIERDPGGVINLRRLFRVEPGPALPAAPAVAPVAPVTNTAAPRPGLLQTMVLDFREIVLEDGYARFLDRTTRPTFSQDISRLALTVRGLSNAPGRRATLTAQGIVGGDAALDLRGELSRLGDDLFADLVGELRDFSLASANPYADSFLSWIIRRGRLAAKVHYRVEQDRISGQNDVVVRNLEVARGAAGDEVQRRIGLPLGLIVALLKDTRGNITFSVPLSGSLSDRRFDWGEAIWSAVKQAVLKVLAAPFRAIGRLFTGGGDTEEKIEALSVDPVTFAPGSSVLGPATEGHLARVGEFLRRSPFVKLALAPVVTALDVESLKAQELTARIQRLQRERGIADFALAVGAYYRDRAITGPPPGTPEEQLRILREREPIPEPRVKELLERRLEAAREALTRIEGVPAARLRVAEPRALLAEPGDGRVEIAVVEE